MFEQRRLQSLVKEYQLTHESAKDTSELSSTCSRSIGFGSNRQEFHGVIFIWINKRLGLPQVPL